MQLSMRLFASLLCYSVFFLSLSNTWTSSARILILMLYK
nr:MAG TPA: hypothetical protein [Caudoviricetes sp.]